MRYKLESDGQTIHVTCENGNDYTFQASPELGAVLALRMHGKKLLIVHEFGLEAFCPALDISRFKLETIDSWPRRVINLNQIRYRLEQNKRRKNHVNIHIFDTGTNPAT